MKTENLKNIALSIGERVTMKDIFSLYGIESDRHGFALCPFHGVKTPSLHIYRNGTRFKCFGCGEGGDVIDFVRKSDGCSFPDALRKIDSAFSLGLFEKPSLRQHRENIAKITQIRREQNEREEERALLEKEYRVRLRLYKLYCDEVERLKPPHPDSPPSEEFLRALNYKTKAECRLDEILNGGVQIGT